MIVIPPRDPNEANGADPAAAALGQLYEQFTNVQNLAEFHAALRKRDALYENQRQEMGGNPADYENLHPKDFFDRFHRRADEDDKSVLAEVPYRMREPLNGALWDERQSAYDRAAEIYKRLFIDHQLAELERDRAYYLGKAADAADTADRERYLTALVDRLEHSADLGLLYKEDAARAIENIPGDLDTLVFNRDFELDPAGTRRLLIDGGYANLQPERRAELLTLVGDRPAATPSAEEDHSETNNDPPASSNDQDNDLASLDSLDANSRSAAVESDLDNHVAIGSHNQPATNLQKNTDSPTRQPSDNQANSTTAQPARAVRGSYVERRPNDRVVFIEYDKGPAEIRSGGSRTWRNHNPGNLVRGDLADFEGAIGSDDKFAIFPDDETGVNAMYGRVYELRDAGKTVDQAIETWAPPNENNTARYKANVHRSTGFSGAEKLNQLSDQQIDSFIDAIRKEEGWQPGRVIYDE